MMSATSRLPALLAACVALAFVACGPIADAQTKPGYEELLELFADWREFESPPLLDGAPDYTAVQFAARQNEFQALREHLQAFEIHDWPIPQQVDWHLVRAEMNGYQFNASVLRPWARDPAFYDTIWTYRSDVPAHEGPTHHALVELWTYEFPLSQDEQRRLISELGVIPPLMKQAQQNLTGNARDLWITGIRDIRGQRAALDGLEETVRETASNDLMKVISNAKTATDDLIAWLEAKAESKTGPSGIGKDNYTWYQQNVHLVPLTWEDEVRLLQRELARAWSSLKLEEQRNRDLPPMVAASTPEEYDAMAEGAVVRIMNFLKSKDIVTVTGYMEPALREHMGAFVPEAQRHFFWITAHYDPAPLFTHFWHWFELARMDRLSHTTARFARAHCCTTFSTVAMKARRPVLRKCSCTRVCTTIAHVHARTRVDITCPNAPLAGLVRLYAHANEMTMEEAGNVHMEWTPRGWMKTEKELLIFEQHLYLRQPGYGTSYVTGKYLLEGTLADYARQVEKRGDDFQLRIFLRSAQCDR